MFDGFGSCKLPSLDAHPTDPSLKAPFFKGQAAACEAVFCYAVCYLNYAAWFRGLPTPLPCRVAGLLAAG
eukprot:365250-Chlamydomonas_euryale.AAC.8